MKKYNFAQLLSRVTTRVSTACYNRCDHLMQPSSFKDKFSQILSHRIFTKSWKQSDRVSNLSAFIFALAVSPEVPVQSYQQQLNEQGTERRSKDGSVS